MVTERADLIAAIRTAPDEDAPRLIAADWFEEQGDEASVARAEFIRTQIERANLPPDDLRQSELQARELRLLKRYAPVWCGSHFVFKKCRFRRGFIEYVHLHLQHFLHHRRQMLALEPVRDLSLTGFYRATNDLVRRVGECEEWKWIETLRIHHQGPHKNLRSGVILLLLSPHLTRLQALHCPTNEFHGVARREFEQLPVLRQVREMYLPCLEPWSRYPREWFSDEGAAWAAQWRELQSLSITLMRMSELRRMVTMPFWSQLAELELTLPMETGSYPLDAGPAFTLLANYLPASLRVLRLALLGSPADFSAADAFLERLAQTPLQTLDLRSIEISPESLGRLFSATSQCEIHELRINGSTFTREHAQVLADAPKANRLRSVDLSFSRHFGEDAAKVFFAADVLRFLTHLNLYGTRLGKVNTIVLGLAHAQGWDRLQSLWLTVNREDTQTLFKLFSSPNLQRLAWLVLGMEEAISPRKIPTEAASRLVNLPHLACLHLGLQYEDEDCRRILTGSESLAWVSFDCSQVEDIQEYRAAFRPERKPPLDAAYEQRLPWR